MKFLLRILFAASASVVAFVATLGMSAAAGAQATPPNGFSLQITPSPIVALVKPGVASQVELQVRNNGIGTEQLKAEVRKFTFDNATGNISIADTPAADLSQWVKLSSPRFTVNPGQVFTQNVTFAFPANSGFSYSFVIVINRQSEPQATGGGRLLQGSIADFGLVNIDRPGAQSQLEIDGVKPSATVYEYLPATLSLKLKNTGNTIVKPYGNIFIQRSSSSSTPIATLNVNQNENYILPGTSRTVTADWTDGFPRFDTKTLSDGTVQKTEVWDLRDISKFRIGEYTAKVVAVYNNGTYDVPLNAETTFWVIPWKILLGALIILLVIGFGIFSIIRSIVKGVRRRKGSLRFRP